MTNQTATLRRLGIVLAITASFAFSGCAAKPKKTDNPVPEANSADENTNGDSDSGKAMGLQTIHFPYDSFTLDGDAKSTLKANADILKDHADVKIQVEGHCDQRGGIQYNIALGEKRANGVKKYLQDLGVSSKRITTISFGKERPVDPSETEEAYSKNRRANFAITSR